MLCRKRRISFFFFFLMIRRPPRSTLSSSSAASDVYKRQWLYHEMGRCAASLAMGTDTTIPTPYQVSPRAYMGVFDVWDQTSSSFGRATVDFAGHHYLDITLEGLVQLFLSQHVCPASGHPPPANIPPSACKTVLKASSKFTPLSLCSCHSDAYRLWEPCISLSLIHI
eukprot:TRINITY_DN31445_c0_g1_i2.p1 TRINITY_DN31445_c0_g1~~TRINITY_DN31445_c0_g1_i2.p1  ORF type:complete len:168 (-),score=28.87 TRINITY_DN31445_c0_g1_i2:83-586(-)